MAESEASRLVPALYLLMFWKHLNNNKVEVNELSNKSRSFIYNSPENSALTPVYQ